MVSTSDILTSHVVVEDFEKMPFEIFAEKAYLNYSMYVILDRALPHIGDGLKPVQRRIVYAMSQLGLSATAKYKKSARTVGDVLGKFHPHGDSACYEAMVLLAQPFSCRYPLLDGQGNWGAQDDPKSFAAMRYTESRLSRYAEILLVELNLGATEWTPNFDGTLKEPSLLPARLPNILLNGASGIAVGMATDIPPHNLVEVANACIYLLDNPDSNTLEPNTLKSNTLEPNTLKSNTLKPNTLKSNTLKPNTLKPNIIKQNPFDLIDPNNHNSNSTNADNFNDDIDVIMQFIKGPDYPTEAEIITPLNEIKDMYLTGIGRIKMRAKYHVEDGDIVVTALPHHASGEKIIEQIAAQMEAKKLPMVVDLRDESDHENPTRVVIVPKFAKSEFNKVQSNIQSNTQRDTSNTQRDTQINTQKNTQSNTQINALMDHLFATTDLEKSYRINMNIIGTNGKPEVKNLLTTLKEWLAFRITTVTKRLHHRLNQVTQRVHILEGFLITFINIDEVVEIIRNEDEPKLKLIEKFRLSEMQADAILEIKLRHIAKLEEIKIRAEKDELDKERSFIEKTLASQSLLNALIKKEIRQDIKNYGDERRSPIREQKEAEAFSHQDVMTIEPLTIILSKNGWVRSAKGHDFDLNKIKFKSGDELLAVANTMSNRQTVFLDSTGRSYSIASHSFPSVRGMGEPLTGRLVLKPDVCIQFMITGDDNALVLIASDNGFGFITQISNLLSRGKNGKAVITLNEGAKIITPEYIYNLDTDLILVITTAGRFLIFPVNEMPILEKGKGNKIIGIPIDELPFDNGEGASGERIKLLKILPCNASIIIYAGKHSLKLNPLNQKIYHGKRGYRGKKLPRGYQNVSHVDIINDFIKGH